MSEALRKLAAAAGLVPEWRDFRGATRTVADATLCAVLKTLGLTCDTTAQIEESLARLARERDVELPPLLVARAGERLSVPKELARPGTAVRLLAEDASAIDLVVEEAGGLRVPPDVAPGYYRADVLRDVTVAIAPPRAWSLDALGGDGRCWGMAVQLYGLRRNGDGGAGDYSALAQSAAAAGRAGADALCISPVHALFDADPSHFSPYAPSSRLFYNTWHVDPSALLGAGPYRELVAELGMAEDLARLERAELIDWPAVVPMRLALLRALFRGWREHRSASDALADELAAFRRAGGEPLESHAGFSALHARQLARGGPWHWREWPAPLRDAQGPGVRRAARELADEVDFHVFAQWLAARGLGAAQRAARDAGMRVGIVHDLAVGTHDGGSHAWSRPEDLLVGLSVGAPPDELNLAGQSWGLTSFSPRALRQHGYAPFLAMLRAALRHAGGVRIDHVLGLNRLWLVPQGAAPTEGAYLRYPLDDLLALTVLESHRHRALLIGEDLGTVPPGFRERLDAAGLLGLRVLWFERAHGLYTDPTTWTHAAAATTSTHDLPTVRGWWSGRDLDWQEQLGLAGPAPREQRRQERRALWAAFEYAGVAPAGVPAEDDATAAVDAAVRHVARAASQLALVPLEDLAGQVEQPNLPGTLDEHPNWRRRYAAPTDELLAQPAAAARVDTLRRARPR
jgi:4-alpha-glucanotransferase